VASFEKRLASMEGTEGAIATSSGMAAILMLCMGLLKAGDHVVCSRSVFGSTIKLIGGEFGKFGVASSFVSQTDVSEWQAAIRPNTRLLFAETPTNPLTEVCDIAALADIARRAGALLAVDNCFATPVLQRPVDWGADIIMHSGTKYLDGQGRVLAGALCCSQALIDEKFMPVLRSAGMTLSPFNAWVVLKGLETLDLRMRAQSARAQMLAEWLEKHPAVARVHYPGLASHPQHALALRQMPRGFSGMISIQIKGDEAHARTVAGKLKLFQQATSLGGVESLVEHRRSIEGPSSTTPGNLLRISVGLEHVDDLWADFEQAL
jgi:O-succinylhomoserine sulfhydrylase